MFNQINENKNIIRAKPVDETTVCAYEKELGVTFGQEFKTYLKEFGCISVDYLEFYGICGNNDKIPSAIHATKSMRKHLPTLPNNLVVFYEIGDGSFYCVDENDEVFLCEYDRCTKVNQTFKDFLFKTIEEI
jgi:hypothetical protein